MLHKHHSLHHLIGFLVGVILMGGVMGGISAYIGTSVVQDANAVRTERLERLTWRVLQRRLRRQKRLQRAERVVSDVSITYPMRVGFFGRPMLSKKWDIALNVGSISYPRLGISAPVARPTITNWKNRNWRALESQMQYGMLNGVTMYPHSVAPGKSGKMIIAGHSSPPTLDALKSPYGEILARLPEARIGDRIEIRDEKGTPFVYEVTKSKEVAATATSILLQDTSDPEMILFTCYPIGTTRNRWAVWLELVEGEEVASTQ